VRSGLIGGKEPKTSGSDRIDRHTRPLMQGEDGRIITAARREVEAERQAAKDAVTEVGDAEADCSR
jgi:hypothetical protein